MSSLGWDEHDVGVGTSGNRLGEFVWVFEVTNGGIDQLSSFLFEKALDDAFVLPMTGIEGGPGESVDGSH